MPTPIEWCDETFNPWWGCERVSPACAHCYADTFARRIGMPELWSEKDHRDDHGFRFFADPHWEEPLKWARTLPDKLGRRPRVFCASMADVFEDRPELEQPRRQLFDLIERTLELDWLILTKRPEVAHSFYFERGWTLTANLWLGTSIENARFTWRADVLREIPAAVRFISAEPLLGSLYDGSRDAGLDAGAAGERGGIRPLRDLRRADGVGGSDAPGGEGVRDGQQEIERATVRGVSGDGGGTGEAAIARVGGSAPLPERSSRARRPLDLAGIDWVIIGGESGPRARPFNLEHARELVDACRDGCRLCAEGMPRVLTGGGESHGYPPIWWHDDGHASYGCTAHGQRGPSIFVKQFGAVPVYRGDAALVRVKLRDRKGGDPGEWPVDLRIREFPRSAVPA